MMPGDDVLPEPTARRVEVFTGAGRRRRWSDEAKILIVAESYATSVGETADRHGLSKTQVFTWRREARKPGERLPKVDVWRLLAEVSAKEKVWLADTSRQERIGVQRETNTIFLKSAV